MSEPRRRWPERGDDTMVRRLIPLVYLVVGVVIAAHDGYLAHLSTVGSVVSALLAVALWPLVLLGIRMTLK